MFFEYIGQEKEKNGRATQHFELRFNGPELDYLDVFFQQVGDPTLFRAEVENRHVAISYHGSAFFRLFAFGGLKNRHYIAQAGFPVFGDSETKVKREPAVFPKNHVPLIEPLLPKFNYWPQTGQHFIFNLDTTFPAKDLKILVMENKRLRVLNPDEKFTFSYVPEHDKRLRRSSAGATRQDTIFAQLTDGHDIYKISYAMLLHRSRTALLDPKPGVALLLGSILFFFIWVAIKRKRSKTAW